MADVSFGYLQLSCPKTNYDSLYGYRDKLRLGIEKS